MGRKKTMCLEREVCHGESWHLNRKEGSWNTGDELEVRLAHVKLIQEELKLTLDFKFESGLSFLSKFFKKNQVTCSVS
jgi:hypothetical protein